MKIAFLSHLDLNLYLFRLPIMKELVSRGVEVYAIVPRGEVFDEFKHYGIKAVEYKTIRGSLNPLNAIKTIKNINEVVKNINSDILHSFTHQPNIYGAFSDTKNYIQTITGLGSFFIYNDLKSKKIRKVIESLYKITSKKAKKVIFQNSDDLNYFVEKGLVNSKKAVLIKSSGIDTKEWVSKNRPKNKKPVVLMVARVLKDKGVEEYIKAAEILKDKAEFWYAGDIDRGNKNTFKPDWKNVKYLGFRSDIKNLIEKCDIFVLPSYREGIPRTLLEAASMSKPIVTTDAVGCREVVDDGFNGFLVPIKDHKSLAKKIEVLIDDKNLREKMGDNSRKKAVSEFDIKVVVSKYLEIYKEVLNGVSS
ncbi:glycosyltransferase family 4 protein [Hippea jasoniae]|uniref:glycosyltransferase family 4 protein n=1 Tax=Hippea jasoniae TaxID=944479 RepID=UPI000556E814|nr:glycosyltransferase family 4 protein [Hippea jasoniae]